MSPAVQSSLARLADDARTPLEAAGLPSDEARRDVVLLARHCLDWDAATWLRRSLDPPPPDFPVAFAAVIRRRAAREPISHIVGAREFYGRPFLVTADVLTPRPETELLVERALRGLRVGTGTAWRVADICTGSGCVGISVALEAAATRRASDVMMVAADLSAAAIAIARRNAAQLGAAVHLVRANLLESFPDATFDQVLANPPYVADTARSALAPEVLREPAGALFAGPDGLDVLRRLIPDVTRCLRPAGQAVIEIGHDQRDAVSRLIDAQPRLRLVEIVADLAGHARVVVAERHAL